MTDEQLAREIAQGLIDTGVEGGFDAVSQTTNEDADYPSIGCSQWEGSRGDALLAMIPGGDYYIGRSYPDIEAAGELDALKELLGGEQGQAAQMERLALDCLELYLPALYEAGLTNPYCIVYAGIWCPTSHDVVRRFITRRAGRGYDVNDLDVLRDLFHDQYAVAAEIPEDCYEGYQNRANNTYGYVVGLSLA